MTFERAEGIVLGDTVYVWITGSSGRPGADVAFLAYRDDEERWKRLRLPPGDPERLGGIAQAGDRIVAYARSDEQGEKPDFVLDPATGSWSELSPDPLSPSFDRAMAWSGQELILFDQALVPLTTSNQPRRPAAHSHARGRI